MLFERAKPIAIKDVSGGYGKSSHLATSDRTNYDDNEVVVAILEYLAYLVSSAVKEG